MQFVYLALQQKGLQNVIDKMCAFVSFLSYEDIYIFARIRYSARLI